MYPVHYDADYTRQPNRVSTFFRLIAVIPWLIVGVIYQIAVLVTVIIAWFALVILGRYPEGLYNFNSGVLRYFVRVTSFSYLVTDRWPSFGIGEDPDYPVRLGLAPPAPRQSRLKVFFRSILVLPLFAVIYPMSLLLEAASVLAWLTIVFRGYQPEGVHRALGFANAWLARVSAYWLLLTDAYPPVGEDPLKQSPEAIQPPDAASTPPPPPPGSGGGPEGR